MEKNFNYLNRKTNSMNHKELRKLQNIQYSILQDVDEVCKKHNISYFLVYGTLLGAVRHKASIPWDNDIDIAMKREEYEKFLKVVEELLSKYELRHICYSEIKYASLSRIIKNDKLFGDVHIDIFIMDNARIVSPILSKISGVIGRFLQIAKLSEFEKNII